MSYEDIVQYQFRSGEKAQENGRKGGIASGVARRRKRSLKEAADLYLSLPVKDQSARDFIVSEGLAPEEVDNQMAMIVGLSQKAMKGDPKAAKVIVDLIGENAKENPVDDQLTKARELLEGIDGVIE